MSLLSDELFFFSVEVFFLDFLDFVFLDFLFFLLSFEDFGFVLSGIIFLSVEELVDVLLDGFFIFLSFVGVVSVSVMLNFYVVLGYGFFYFEFNFNLDDSGFSFSFGFGLSNDDNFLSFVQFLLYFLVVVSIFMFNFYSVFGYFFSYGDFISFGLEGLGYSNVFSGSESLEGIVFSIDV